MMHRYHPTAILGHFILGEHLPTEASAYPGALILLTLLMLLFHNLPTDNVSAFAALSSYFFAFVLFFCCSSEPHPNDGYAYRPLSLTVLFHGGGIISEIIFTFPLFAWIYISAVARLSCRMVSYMGIHKFVHDARLAFRRTYEGLPKNCEK